MHQFWILYAKTVWSTVEWWLIFIRRLSIWLLRTLPRCVWSQRRLRVWTQPAPFSSDDALNASIPARPLHWRVDRKPRTAESLVLSHWSIRIDRPRRSLQSTYLAVRQWRRNKDWLHRCSQPESASDVPGFSRIRKLHELWRQSRGRRAKRMGS